MIEHSQDQCLFNRTIYALHIKSVLCTIDWMKVLELIMKSHIAVCTKFLAPDKRLLVRVANFISNISQINPYFEVYCMSVLTIKYGQVK